MSLQRQLKKNKKIIKNNNKNIALLFEIRKLIHVLLKQLQLKLLIYIF